MMRRLVPAVAALALAVVPVLATAQQAVADDEPAPKKLFTMDDERITESSSLAKSPNHEDTWWTANDSSDTARVFAVGKDGETKAEVTFSAEPRDVEALGVGTNGRIYVADIGDNLSNQDKVTVYSIPEPETLEDQKVKVRAYEFKYPDGPHNAEALLVNPQTNRLYFVTKELPRGGIYAAPTPDEMSRDEVNDLEKIGTAPAIVTDGTFTPDGKRVLLRTISTLNVFSWPALKQVASRGLPQSNVVGESLAMGPADDTVLYGSEGKDSPVYQVAIPVAKKTGPTPSATPKPEGSSGSDSGNNSSTKQGHTMRWTLIGAGAFAALMAMFTFPRGRRERADALMESQSRRRSAY